MAPRLTDWSLALAIALAFVSGIISLVSGQPDQWLVFALHGAAGLWLAVILYGKIQRVLRRLVRFHSWNRRTLFGLLALLVAGGLASPDPGQVLSIYTSSFTPVGRGEVEA